MDNPDLALPHLETPYPGLLKSPQTTKRRSQPAIKSLAYRLSISAFILITFGCGSGESITAPVNEPGIHTETREAADPPPPSGRGYIYRFAKVSNGAYFYTGNIAERDQILRSYPDFRYEGIAFLQSLTNPSSPVYRFANIANGGYFYTASVAERDATMRNFPNMRYEGSTFSVATGTSTASTPVYRLANVMNGAYLYTIQPQERSYALAIGAWRDEGIAFQAPTGPSSGPNTSGGTSESATDAINSSSCVSLTRSPSSGELGFSNNCSKLVVVALCLVGAEYSAYECTPSPLGGGTNSYAKAIFGIPAFERDFVISAFVLGSGQRYVWFGCSAGLSEKFPIPDITSLNPTQGVCRTY